MNTAACNAWLGMAQRELLKLSWRLLADDFGSDALHCSLSLSFGLIIRVAINHKLELSGHDERLFSLNHLVLSALGTLPAGAIAFDRSLDFNIQIIDLLCKLHRYSLFHRLDVALSDRRRLRDKGVTLVLLLYDCQSVEVGLWGLERPQYSGVVFSKGCPV